MGVDLCGMSVMSLACMGKWCADVAAWVAWSEVFLRLFIWFCVFMSPTCAKGLVTLEGATFRTVW